jgi:hypothetical protein
VPPSFRVSVGAPPATVTFSLKASVSPTVLPAPRSPVAGDSLTPVIVGGVEPDPPSFTS